MKWDNLTMSQKQALMKIYVNNGITNLDEIVNHYNRFSEGGSKETVESPNNTVLYSRTPRESVGNVVNTRPVPGLITMTEVPKIGAGISMPISKTINDILIRKAASNNTNVINVDSINANRPVSYITGPRRINRFDYGGDKEQNDNTRVQMPRTDVEPIKIPDEELKWMGWREQTYPNGETYMIPPLATGALTPVYPEFELLTGIRAAATGVAKGVKAASEASSKAVKINSKITADNLADITDEMWDEAYNAAIANNDLVEAQRLRDLHFKAKATNSDITFDAEGNPVVWYTGSEWGGHNIFDSSKMNATIGGSSVKGDKGNFLTTDLPSAERYAGHSRYNTRTVDTHEPPKTAIDKIKNVLGLYEGKPIHPVNRISEDLQPDLKNLYDTRGEYVIDRVGSDKVKSTVYPMYVNVEDVRVVDFQGNPWSSSPITPKNSFVVNTETKNNVLKTDIKDSKKFSNKEEALQYYNSLDETHGPYFDYSDLESRTFVDRERSINKWSGNPNYNKAKLIEIKTPSTTNGIVQESFLDGYNTVYMPNVIDSNGGIEGISYAIDDLVTKNSNQMKLANPITYADDGTIIPLSKRDNFLNPDIRYVLAPAFMAGAGYNIYNTINNTSTHKYGGKVNRFDEGGETYISKEALPEVVITPKTSALARSREATGPNINFRNAQDMSLWSKIGATLFPFITDPHTCLNTITGFYNPDSTAASNPIFISNPEKWGFTEIDQKDVQPGDVIILSNKKNHPTHAVLFDSVAEEGGIHNKYAYEAGDTLVNYSNGGRGINDYRLQGPLSRFDDPNMAGGDFSGKKRYYTYVGKKKKNKK